MPDMTTLEGIAGTARRTNIRERALRALERVRETQKFAVQVRERGLSPGEMELNRQYRRLLEDADVRLSDRLRSIAQQNAAADAQEAEYRRASPLAQARVRDGLRRSGEDRTAAILGFLDRERRLNAPLTRQQWVGAKAIAASRGRFDVKSAYRAGAVTPGVSGTFGPEHLRGVDISKSDVDPCAEYCARQKVRKEVMFAQRSAGRGYSGSRSKHPCAGRC